MSNDVVAEACRGGKVTELSESETDVVMLGAEATSPGRGLAVVLAPTGCIIILDMMPIMKLMYLDHYCR